MKSVTVAVISVSGAHRLARCLDALAAQRAAPRFDVVVVYDPRLTDVPEVGRLYPQVRLVCNEGQRTPLEMVPRAIREAHGELVLLTKDHCTPRPDWVRRLCSAHQPGRAVVGGAIDTDPAAPGVDWALYFFDFHRYANPVPAGPSPTLSVCNVSYRRAHLEEIRSVWESAFHEAAINDALRERFGPLWMVPQAEVRTRRHVGFVDAVYERYVFGRSFGRARLSFAAPALRACYKVFAPAVPLLLLGRMTRVALTCRRLVPSFIRALPALGVFALAWGWGEWLGYLTCRAPRTFTVAPEIRS